MSLTNYSTGARRQKEVRQIGQRSWTLEPKCYKLKIRAWSAKTQLSKLKGDPEGKMQARQPPYVLSRTPVPKT